MTLRWIQREGTGRLISNRDPKTDKAGIGSFLEMYETLSFFSTDVSHAGATFFKFDGKFVLWRVVWRPEGYSLI